MKIHIKEKEERTKNFFNDLTDAFCNLLLGEKIPLDIVNVVNNETELLIPAYRKITKTHLRKVAKNYKTFKVDPSPIRNKMLEIVNRVKLHYGIE